MSIQGGISRDTLANANRTRDCHIYADFAQVLIHTDRKLHVDDGFGVELDNTVCALDATTIDLRLSVSPWAQFRTTKGTVKLHTPMDLRGNIPTFMHVSDGKPHDVNVLDLLVPEAGAFHIMDRDHTDFARLHWLSLNAAFLVIRGQSNLQCRRLYSRPVDKRTGLRCDRPVVPTGFQSARNYLDKLRRIKCHDEQNGQNRRLSDQQLLVVGVDHCRPPPLPVAGGAVLRVDQAASANQVILRHNGERCENANMGRRLGISAGRHHQEAAPPPGQPPRNSTDFEFGHLRENSLKPSICRKPSRHGADRDPNQLNLFD